MIEEEKKKISKPINEIDPKDLENRPIMFYFVTDPSLIDEFNDINAPIKKRYKYTVMFDIAWIFAVFRYCKNVHYYAERFYPNRRKGLGNMLMISFVHCFGFISTFLAGNFFILGIHPVSFYHRHKALSKKMIESDPHKDLTVGQFLIKYTEIEDLEDQKRQIKKQLEQSKNNNI